MEYYIATIRSRGYPYTTKEELDLFYNRCKSIFKGGDWSTFCCYEITAKGRRLHLHTIAALPSTIRFAPLMKLINKSRMYLHLKNFPIEDLNNVFSYICKQHFNPYELEQILIRNEYYHKYGFLD